MGRSIRKTMGLGLFCLGVGIAVGWIARAPVCSDAPTALAFGVSIILMIVGHLIIE